jgi:hypothetical protein
MRTKARIALAIAMVGCGTGRFGGGGPPGSADAAVPTADAPPPITPGAPGAADVHVTIDSTRDAHAISPFIYGSNGPDWTNDAALYSLARSGGNRMTAYNWENNASNAGTDYLNENDDYLGGGTTPGKAVTDGIAAAHAHGAAMIVTVPIQGYVRMRQRSGATRTRRDHGKRSAHPRVPRLLPSGGRVHALRTDLLERAPPDGGGGLGRTWRS